MLKIFSSFFRQFSSLWNIFNRAYFLHIALELQPGREKKKDGKHTCKVAIVPCRSGSADGEASVRLIARVQASVEIIRGTDWSVRPNNTVHRRRLNRSSRMAMRSILPRVALAKLLEERAACTIRSCGHACEFLYPLHRNCKNEIRQLDAFVRSYSFLFS